MEGRDIRNQCGCRTEYKKISYGGEKWRYMESIWLQYGVQKGWILRREMDIYGINVAAVQSSNRVDMEGRDGDIRNHMLQYRVQKGWIWRGEMEIYGINVSALLIDVLTFNRTPYDLYLYVP